MDGTFRSFVAIVEAERQDTYVIKQLKTQVIQRVY
jgi:hypothetical protein